jgi:NAD/NADP transhydrogenase alpha subunit
MKNYDLSKVFRRPEFTERLRKNGYTIQVTSGDGSDKKIVDEYFVSPEEVEAYDKCRKNHRVQK